jgi:NAD dependent epimerase/dehydratase family enzyme
VIFRAGVVMSPDGGALTEFRKPLRFGLATVFGNGKQAVSWIHIDDLVNLYIRALEDARMEGVYNAVAPQPVTNNQLITAVAKSRKRSFIRVFIPSFLLKWVLGGVSYEILKSATVSCERIKSTGFIFAKPLIETAV